MSKFGRFSGDGSEYLITQPETPRPLMNYIWNARILAGVNHFGGGRGAYGGRASSYIDPGGRGRASLIRGGSRYFYVRDGETGACWNPGWYPVRRRLDSYRCAHGLGYSQIEGSLDGITIEAGVFANEEDPVEIWTLNLKNESPRARGLLIYAFVEFALTGYPTYSDYYSYVWCEFDPERNMIVAHNDAQERPHAWFNGFMASSGSVSGFDTSKRAFLGTYGDAAAPSAVLRGGCGNTLAACEDMVGALEHSLSLRPGEETVFYVLIGAADSRDRAAGMADKLFAPGRIEADLASLRASKRKMIEDITVRTPVARLNHITNMWAKQQVMLCAEAGRATGKGFRDQLQDSWAVASFNPGLAKGKILETLRHEYPDGRCVRGWLPLDPHIYSDGPTWIAPTINAYLKETGDYDFLQAVVPYLEEGEGTVWEHILTAVRYSSEDLGRHGLVLAHDGDWNDSLNGIGVGGRGESVWTSIALCHALRNAAEIAAEVLGDRSLAEELAGRAERIKESVNEYGWDGDWYLAGFDDNGNKVGSREEKEGSIYLNSQTWAILAGVAEGERLRKCLEAIDGKLDSPYGPLTLYPPYRSYKPAIGRLTGFVPGIWENGTPYCHGGAFKVVADCCAGRGEEAYSSAMKIVPDSEGNPSDRSGCEPYVFTNMYFGPDNPRAGETAFAWVTGTAGWMFRAVTQYMMGFYPGYGRIAIRPCIPAQWKECFLRRRFRGDLYELRVINQRGGQRVGRIRVDGKEIEGSDFACFGDGGEHTIEVELV